MSKKSQRLRAARLAKGITQEQAANDLHVALTTYKGWEQGTEPRNLDTAARVCEYLGISLDYYITGRQCAPPLDADQQRALDITSGLPEPFRNSLLDTLEVLTDTLETVDSGIE